MRSDGSTFHAGLVMTRVLPSAHVWHADNNTGAFTIQNKENPNALLSKHLCCAYRLGVVDQAGWTKCFQVLERMKEALSSMPGGPPSTYRCNTFAREAVQELHDNGVIQLTKSVPSLYQEAVTDAQQICLDIEQGRGNAHVWNDTQCSTTT